MRKPHFARCTLSVQQLEERCTPAAPIPIFVTTTNWNPAVVGSLPWAVNTANAANGQDEIRFDWTALGTNTPIFNVPVGQTLEVTDGVLIEAGGAGVYSTFTNFRPFNFTHNKPGGINNSVINGGIFINCIVPVATDYGGAIQITGGTLVVNYNRFVNNSAKNAGAISLNSHTRLIIGAVAGTPPAPEAYPEVLGSSATLFQGSSAALNGGAIDTFDEGIVEIRRAAFIENKSGAGDGGAIAVFEGGVIATPFQDDGQPIGVLTTPEVKFYRNEARDGGAIHFFGCSNSSLTNGEFTGNKATGDGGAIRLISGTVNIIGGTMSHNTAGGDGGAIMAGNLAGFGGTINATSVAFVANVVPPGFLTDHIAIAGTGVFNDIDSTCTYEYVY